MGLRGTVNLTMPLSAWLGWTQSPGEVPGFGPLDAGDSRTLATRLARNPANRWCVTLTNHADHPIAHACARPGPRPPTGPPGPAASTSPGTQADPSPRASPSTSASPATRPGPGTRAGPGDRLPDREPSRDRPPATRPPATAPPDWLRGLAFTTLETGTCSHPRQGRGYQPGRNLRHLIEIRNPTCTAPDCRRNATRCDLDHVTGCLNQRDTGRRESAGELGVV